MDMKAVETWLGSELETTEARLRFWRAQELMEAVAIHGDGNFVDAAQQTTVVETRSDDAARLADRFRRLARALERLHNGRYGICEECDAAIAPARLLAVPHAELCLTCQHAWERSAVWPGCHDGARRPSLVGARARRERPDTGHREDPRRARRDRERQDELAG